MEKLSSAQTLLVQQRKEWGEILTGFETKNKYAVQDPSGQQLYWAAEESGFFTRSFFKNSRPFVMHVLTEQGTPALDLRRPFRFFFHEISIYDSSGNFLGMVKEQLSFFCKKLIVKDNTGQEIYKIHGPLLHPWTFRLLENELEVGKISKKWSGMGKEMFSDADNFNITFPSDASVEKKAILLGALFLIDVRYFEKSK